MQTANRVAKNTIVQYIRLMLSVLIGLFSIRIILNSLGASDYGVYNLLGGTIGLLTFISNSLSQTSIRFISVSLGKNDIADIRKTFNACFTLHLIIAGILVAILEIIALFLFNGFLNIPKDRVISAQIVYHCMVLTLFLNVAVTPFKAVLVAHEKFMYTACIGIFDVLCKLAIALIISIAFIDKLILYGILMALIVIIDVSLYIGYVLFKYREEISIRNNSKKDIINVVGFAGWTLLDVFASVINRQGYAVLLNKFFGPVTNAVYALAGQVEGNLYTVSSSVMETIKPQIMKSQGAGDANRVLRLSMTAGKFGFSMMSLLSIPLIVMMPEVLDLWLKDVPQGTVLFSRLLVIACMFEQLTRGLVHANQAIGNIKWFCIIVSTIRMTAMPISLICFLCGAPAYTAIIVFLCCETLGSFSRVIVMSKTTDLKILNFVKSVFFQIIPPFIVAFIVSWISYRFFHDIEGMIAVCFITATTYILLLYTVGLTKEERMSINGMIKSLINHFIRPRMSTKIN